MNVADADSERHGLGQDPRTVGRALHEVEGQAQERQRPRDTALDCRPTFGSLFTGIGGLDLGLERAGWDCRWQVEIDPWCRAVLTRHWPDVPRHDDIKTFRPETPVDLICGGFPCQPVSTAGRQRAQEDDRWLWPEFARVVRVLRPRWVLIENVPGLLTTASGRAAQAVFGGLSQLGYDAEWASIPAAAVGAPHLRYRVFIVANRQAHAPRPDADQFGSHREAVDLDRGSELRDEQVGQPGSLGSALPVADGAGLPVFQGQHPDAKAPGRALPYADPWWAVEPNVGRVADGVPAVVDRLRALGNAVVPAVAEYVGRRILEGGVA